MNTISLDIYAEANAHYEETLTTVAALLLACMNDARQKKISRRYLRRQYLCRPQLLPYPRYGTPWQRLLASSNDRAYITTMGVNVDTFQYILNSGFRYLWETTSITRTDTSARGEPRLAARSLDAAGGLGLYLHWITSTMREVSLQQVFALVPATVSRYLNFAENILHATLKLMPEARVAWPESVEEFEQYSQLIQARHPRLIGAFGAIDGLELPVQVSYKDPELENATYNGWLHSHCVSSVMTFAPDGTIMAAQLNAPGSWHDSRVAHNIYAKLENQTPDDYYLVADTAFPRGMSDDSCHLRAPLKSGDTVPADPELLGHVMAFNRQLLSYRQTAEWGMRQLQGSFGRLRLPLDITSNEGRLRLLEIVVRLNNVRARRVGISEIRGVYMPIWRHDDGSELWDDLGTRLLSDISRSDRVSRFHLVVR